MKPPVKKKASQNLYDRLSEAKQRRKQYSVGGYDPAKGTEYLLPKEVKQKKRQYAKSDVRNIKKQIRKAKKS